MEKLELIKSRQLAARKEGQRVKASLLTTIIGEADMGMKGKGFDIDALLKKFLKNTDIALSHQPNNEMLLEERKILMEYLPKQLTEDEIRGILDSLDDVKNMKIGMIMGHFNKHYKGQFNGKDVMCIINSLK